MRYSVTATFFLAAVILPAWCDSREDGIYDPDNAALANQIPDGHQSYETYTAPRQVSDRKTYYQQNDLKHYAMAQDNNNYHQFRAQPPRQLNKDEESALSNLALRAQEADDDTEDGEKGDRNPAYQQMKHAGNNFAPFYQRPNMMMNGGQNFRPPFAPKFTMEQQMQMQMQLQRQQMQQRMMAAAQAQNFMNQQPQPFVQPPAQQFAQPQAQQFVQPPAQQFVQHYKPPAPVPSQTPLQSESYPVNRGAVVPPKARYPPQPPATQGRYAPPPTTTQPWTQPPTHQAYYEDYDTSRQKE